ncbi:thioesterase II family protein [Desulfoplanes formicivorans]|uniref:Gramicidin dehydrogenase n=1 Tax=Desulfoplanes formicivorans TaxID=1592317 RepID=A0A194AIP4_9BACT|nr:alpha/beta fold hydrolase [Desulfoplanes formicivorans]GAU08624.1 gramicidin dehydrogenase [Desulfoplanes formicivorans]
MITLFLLGHAGGSASMYPALFPNLSSRVQLVPLDLPGHGQRMGEALLDNIPDMVADLQCQVEAYVDGNKNDYALFGHSMGGILAYALTTALQETARMMPQHVIISSTCTPGRHHIAPQLPFLPDEELWVKSAGYFGGIQDQIVASRELMTLFVPILRTDLKAVLDWSPSPCEAVDVPMTVVCGDRDIVDEADVLVWRRYTTEDFVSSVLPGGHFHVLERPSGVETVLKNTLGQYVSGHGNCSAAYDPRES